MTPPSPNKHSWFLQRAPFIDVDLLAEAPAGDHNIVATIQALRLTFFVVLGLLFMAEGIAVFHTEGTAELTGAAAGACVLSLLLFYAEGLIVRTVIVAGSVKQGRLGVLSESSSVLFRAGLALFAAAIVTIALTLNVHRVDIANEHRRGWLDENAVRFNAANAMFEMLLEPKRDQVKNLETELKELAAPAADADIERDNAEIARLTTLINAKVEQLTTLEEKHLRLGFQLECELRGEGCFGATRRRGDGPEADKVRLELAEVLAQIGRINKEMAQHQAGLEAVTTRRDAAVPDAATLKVLRQRRQALQNQLITAKEQLADAASGRDAFVARQVPYNPPGVAEQFTLLLRLLLREPVNLAIDGLWGAWLFFLEMTVVSSALTLRHSVYGISLRSQLRRAATEAAIRAVDDEIRLADAKESVTRRNSQQDLFEEFLAAMRKKRDQSIAAE